MINDPKSLTSYLEIVDQRRRYRQHMRNLQEAQPKIDTSPIPMNQSIAEKQQQNAMNRVFKFQLEEDKIKFANDLYEYNRLHKKKKKYLKPKSSKNKSSQYVSNIQTANNPLEILAARRSNRSKRNYPKLIEPKITRKRKMQMSIQTSYFDDQNGQLYSPYQTMYEGNEYGQTNDYDVDIPFEYTGYLSKGGFSIVVDEENEFCVESVINVDDENL